MINVNLRDLVFDAAAMNRLLRSPNGETGRWMAGIVRDVEGESKRLLSGEMVNVRTGRLRASQTHVVIEERGEIVGLAGSNTVYALAVHESGRPYLTTAADRVLRRLGLSS